VIIFVTVAVRRSATISPVKASTTYSCPSSALINTAVPTSRLGTE
jgi:hypothetical protein